MYKKASQNYNRGGRNIGIIKVDKIDPEALTAKVLAALSNGDLMELSISDTHDSNLQVIFDCNYCHHASSSRNLENDKFFKMELKKIQKNFKCKDCGHKAVNISIVPDKSEYLPKQIRDKK